MLTKGPAKKLSVYVDESDKYGSRPVYEVVLDILYRNRIGGASIFRGVAGYGSDRVFHTAKILELSGDLPVKIEAIDSDEAIRTILPDLERVVGKGLIEITDTFVIKCSKCGDAGQS